MPKAFHEVAGLLSCTPCILGVLSVVGATSVEEFEKHHILQFSETVRRLKSEDFFPDLLFGEMLTRFIYYRNITEHFPQPCTLHRLWGEMSPRLKGVSLSQWFVHLKDTACPEQGLQRDGDELGGRRQPPHQSLGRLYSRLA